MAAQIKQEVKDPELELVTKKQKGKMTRMSIDLTGDISWSDDEEQFSKPPPRPSGSGAPSSHHTPATYPPSVTNIATPGTSQTCHQNISSPTSTPKFGQEEEEEETEDDRTNKRTLFIRNLPRDATPAQVNISLK